jgi:hypothetical protein
MRTSKIVLVWFGVRSLNLRLNLGVRPVGWVFSLSQFEGRMTLTFDQIRAYFETRHPGQKIGTRAKVSVKCIFHDDRTPSCTLFLDGAGGFHCNGCGAGGNVFQFEARFSQCTVAEAEAKVAEITGAKAGFGSFAKLGPVIATYDYRDDDERVLFQKRRYHLDTLIEQLGRFGAEFIVLDVFRSLHDGEENDNTEVAEVLSKVNRLQNELNCAVALVHHITKAEGGGDIFRGLRGASAIHGWMEWGIGISVTNPDEEDRAKRIRRAEFESKESTAQAIYYKIAGSDDSAAVRLEQLEKPEEASKRRATTASIVPLPTRERKDLA